MRLTKSVFYPLQDSVSLSVKWMFGFHEGLQTYLVSRCVQLPVHALKICFLGMALTFNIWQISRMHLEETVSDCLDLPTVVITVKLAAGAPKKCV